jgi:F-type H+-transporting ATPase subunit b
MTVADFFSAAQAYASAAAEGEHHGPSINDVWFQLINFIIYAFIIVKFGFPLIRDFLKTRRAEVVAKIAQASAKKQAAEALVRDYRSKLAGLGKEVQSLQAMLREEGEREKTRLVNEALATAVKIKEDTNFLADQEVKTARQKLREEIADEAVASARQLIERNISAADQSRLVDDFVRSVGQTR